MPAFGDASKRRLAELHPDLQRVCLEVIEHFNFTIVCGHRGEIDQNMAFEQGRSKLRWPDGKHNTLPSNAMDLMYFPIDWEDTKGAILFAGFVLGTARQMGIGLRWGGDWDRDWSLKNNRFNDYPHFELVSA